MYILRVFLLRVIDYCVFSQIWKKQRRSEQRVARVGPVSARQFHRSPQQELRRHDVSARTCCHVRARTMQRCVTQRLIMFCSDQLYDCSDWHCLTVLCSELIKLSF